MNNPVYTDSIDHKTRSQTKKNKNTENSNGEQHRPINTIRGFS